MSDQWDPVVMESFNRLWRLVDVAGTPDDPAALLVGEEIERLSRDEAQTLLLFAVLLIWEHRDSIAS